MWSIFVAFFQLLILVWETMTSVLQTNNTNIVGNGEPNVLWHSMKNLVNLIRQLTNIKFLCLAKLKPEQTCIYSYELLEGTGRLQEF